jgi:hypothetical protein
VTPWHDESAGHMFLYLSDVILTRFVEAIVNESVFSEFMQPRFKRARELYALRATAFSNEDNVKFGLNDPPDFESFVSSQLGFDYVEFKRNVKWQK